MPDLEEVFRMSTQKVRPEPGALERQFGKQRRRSTRQRVAVYALVVGLVAGTAIGFASLGREEDRPGNPDPGPSLPVIEGQLPTPSLLNGIWLEDRGRAVYPVLVRFSLDGTFAIDNGGRLDTTPVVLGTYEIDGRRITFTTDGSRDCFDGESWAWEVGLPEDGRLEGVHAVDNATAACSLSVGTRWNLTRVSPSSPGSAAIVSGEVGPDALPPSSPFSLAGIWVREGTGQLFRYAPGGGYAFADGGMLGTDPFDVGDVELNPDRGTITFTTGEGSRGCTRGDRVIWENVQLEGDTLRAVVRRDGCTGQAGLELTWIRVGSENA